MYTILYKPNHACCDRGELITVASRITVKVTVQIWENTRQSSNAESLLCQLRRRWHIEPTLVWFLVWVYASCLLVFTLIQHWFDCSFGCMPRVCWFSSLWDTPRQDTSATWLGGLAPVIESKTWKENKGAQYICLALSRILPQRKCSLCSLWSSAFQKKSSYLLVQWNTQCSAECTAWQATWINIIRWHLEQDFQNQHEVLNQWWCIRWIDIYFIWRGEVYVNSWVIKNEQYKIYMYRSIIYTTWSAP